MQQTTTRYSLIHIIAMLGGTLAYVSNGANDIQAAAEMSGRFLDSTTIVIAALTLGSIITSGCMGWSFQKGKYASGAALFMTWVCLATFSMTISTERLAKQRLDQVAQRNVLQLAIKYQRENLDRATAQAEKYCSRGKRYKSKCNFWTLKRDSGSLALDKAPRVGSSDIIGPIVVSAARSMGITLDNSDGHTVLAALASFAIMLMGMTVTSFGFAGDRIPPEFALQTMGRNAEEDKARRFAEQFEAANGRAPSVNELSGNLDISYNKARRLKKLVTA